MRPDPELIIEEIEDAEPMNPADIAEAEHIFARILFNAFLEHIGAARPAAEKAQAAV